MGSIQRFYLVAFGSLSTPSLAAQGGAMATTCCPPPGNSGPCCIGDWDGPYSPLISCPGPFDPSCPQCGTDEIAHAALIPCGAWPLSPGGDPESIAGMVLIWTRCTVRAPTADPYKTHLWDPNNEGSVAFSAPILDRINAAPDRTEDGPFCSGHAWILDQDKNPKLLVVGGEDRGDNDSMTPVAYEDQDPAPGFQNPCVGTSFVCGLHKVYWFDPLVAGPDNAWSDSPPDLSEGRWYPSVTTYLNAGQDEFRHGGGWDRHGVSRTLPS